ncbi:hypothetical protein [Alicyclobacillus sp. ALC3]|uniref:hypothetical protein n=1 Tax=Alicyclobacillus sp. ALC3 TaxID=2796143 RepID=UPI00237976FB|nr:hypothetical protein [Alicyclobacillus sp. ALC3]WDL97769.1 hypothetical protein JC200_03285 [Alicyclobacillus sp. ALC3]
MENKLKLVEQTQLAFDFIQKLYMEVSFLIKEVESTLNEEEETFVIGKPSGGYAITARSSNGLEVNNVNLWLLRKLAVFFVPEAFIDTESKGTPINESLRVIYMRIVLNDKSVTEPTVHAGVLYDFEQRKHQRLEQCMGLFEYVEHRMFKDPEHIAFEDSNVKLRGKLMPTSLYDLNTSEDVVERLIKPTLQLFREIP